MAFECEVWPYGVLQHKTNVAHDPSMKGERKVHSPAPSFKAEHKVPGLLRTPEAHGPTALLRAPSLKGEHKGLGLLSAGLESQVAPLARGVGG